MTLGSVVLGIITSIQTALGISLVIGPGKGNVSKILKNFAFAPPPWVFIWIWFIIVLLAGIAAGINTDILVIVILFAFFAILNFYWAMTFFVDKNCKSAGGILIFIVLICLALIYFSEDWFSRIVFGVSLLWCAVGYWISHLADAQYQIININEQINLNQ